MAEKEKKTGRRVSVLERRLQNPFGEPSMEIRMKDPHVFPRWFNDDLRNGQVYRAQQLGWEYVTTEMIADMNSVGFHGISPEGRITRGAGGKEVLMWMPQDAYKAVQAAKTQKNLDLMRDTDRQKLDALNAFASEAGGTAAEFMSNKVRVVGGVRTVRERVAHDADETVFGGDERNAH